MTSMPAPYKRPHARAPRMRLHDLDAGLSNASRSLLMRSRTYLVGDEIVDALYEHAAELEDSVEGKHAADTEAADALEIERDDAQSTVRTLHEGVTDSLRELSAILSPNEKAYRDLDDALERAREALDGIDNAEDVRRALAEAGAALHSMVLSEVGSQVDALTELLKDNPAP